MAFEIALRNTHARVYRTCTRSLFQFLLALLPRYLELKQRGVRKKKACARLRKVTNLENDRLVDTYKTEIYTKLKCVQISTNTLNICES